MVKNNKFWYSIGAIIIGLILGLLLLLATGQSISEFWISIYQSSFNNWISFGNLLSVVAWIILISLAFSISFRAGIFNIGIVGQFVAAGLFTYIFINQSDISSRWAILITIFFPIIIGMVFAWLIAFLKTHFKVHEVLSSILLNAIIFWLYIWFTTETSGAGQTIIPSNFSLQFAFLADQEGSFVNYGIISACLFLILTIFIYKKTTWGYRQSVLGSKNQVLYYAGINYNKEFTKAMIFSGAMAGLASGVFYFGCNQNLPLLANSLPFEPWFGLAIILVAFNNFLGIIILSILFGLVENAIFVNGASLQIVNILNLLVIVWILLAAIFYAFIVYKPQELFVDWLKNIHRKNLYPFKINHHKQKIQVKNNFFKYLDYIRFTKTIYDVKGKEYKKREGKYK